VEVQYDRMRGRNECACKTTDSPGVSTEISLAFIAQLGERQTEDLEVGSSILPEGIFSFSSSSSVPGMLQDEVPLSGSRNDLIYLTTLLTPPYMRRIVHFRLAPSKYNFLVSLYSSVGRAPD
jgi:hypothetical protein